MIIGGIHDGSVLGSSKKLALLRLFVESVYDANTSLVGHLLQIKNICIDIFCEDQQSFQEQIYLIYIFQQR